MAGKATTRLNEIWKELFDLNWLPNRKKPEAWELEILAIKRYLDELAEANISVPCPNVLHVNGVPHPEHPCSKGLGHEGACYYQQRMLQGQP